MATKITAGSVRKGMVLRLANRPREFPFGAMWVVVADVQVESAPRRKNYTIMVDGEKGQEPGLYGTFGHPTRFELQPEQAVKAPKTRTPGARTVRSSVALREAIRKLAQSELGETPEEDGQTKGLTRKELNADPMVVVALANRGWATVDRSGDERAVDYIELTTAGAEQARAWGYFSAE
jgi:hypothetical protein